MASEAKPYLAFEDYLRIERAAETKSEYYEGQMYPLFGETKDHAAIGATGNHASIAINVGATLLTALQGKGCRVFDSSLRVGIPNDVACFYPDVSVTCEQPLYRDKSNDVLLNPALIIEVLSPSTQSYDRGDKFFAYRTIPTLRDYLLVSQDRVLVEHFQLFSARWTLIGEYRDLESSTIDLLSIRSALLIGDFYRGLRLPNG